MPPRKLENAGRDEEGRQSHAALARWIEALTGLDPDHHNGSLEWAIVVGIAVISIVVARAAQAE
jgi:hypothetical protein